MNRTVLNCMKIILSAGIVVILLLIIILALWSMTGQWQFPNLWPETFSTRAIGELFGGYSGAIDVLCFSVGLSLIVSVLTVVISIMTARALVFYDFWGKEFIKFSSILPIIVPGTVFAMGIHIILIKLGLSDAISGVIIVHLITCLPYTIKIMTDVTKIMGQGLAEQAQVLGATAMQTFLQVTLPLLTPGIIASLSISYIVSFSQYFLTLLIGGGQVKTFSMLLIPYVQSGDRTIAASYSMVFILSTLVLFIVFEKLAKKYYAIDNSYFFS